MLKNNAVSVEIFLIVTTFTEGIWHSLNAAVFSIVLVYAFRCVLAEYHVTRLLELDLRINILEDLLMCGIFIISGWVFGNFLCMVMVLPMRRFYWSIGKACCRLWVWREDNWSEECFISHIHRK